MAKKREAKPARKAGKQPAQALLEQFMRTRAGALLDDKNVSSVGIGHKIKGGKRSAQLCIQVTVHRKLSGADALEGAGTTAIPKEIEFEGVRIPTDVIERSFKPSYRELALEAKSERKRRLDPMRPGVSVSHPKGTAGTLGAIVFDARTGDPCILSNWHVLQTPDGEVGERIVQPGPFDDNRIDQNGAGVLLRSHLGLAGDCAVARIEGRGWDAEVLELAVKPDRIATVELGDHLVKSGRTTDVTYGVVRRVQVVTKLDYGKEGVPRIERISGFEIGPDEARPAPRHQISEGGDSGSAWLVLGEDGRPTTILAGLHFAGEGQGDPDDHAMACYAHAVLQKLEVGLQPPAAVERAPARGGSGYDPGFVGVEVAPPEVADAEDVYRLDGSALIPYTHFSVCLSKSRRMAHYVAWNVDGGQVKRLSRAGLPFELDPRVDERYQLGNDLYESNKLDRGHIARRADLVWGSRAEAEAGNRDSFFYTNITPQHQAFNQSQRAGLWGLLENAVFEETEVEGLRLTVLGGPIFKASDREYRGARIPASFWKALFFREAGQLRVKAYVLTQDDLLNDIEALELDEFRMYEVRLEELERRAGLRFAAALKRGQAAPEAVAGRRGRPAGAAVKEILGPEMLLR